MKNLVSLLSLLLYSITFAFGIAAADSPPSRVAVVDLNRVYTKSSLGAELNRELEKFREKMQVDLGEQQKTMQELQKQLSSSEVSDEQKAKLNKQIENEQRALQQFLRKKRVEADTLRNEGIAKIEAQLKPVVDKVRKDKGYDVVFNTVSGVVVAYSSAADITELVISQMGEK